jgi:hypothetical protein
MKLLVENVKRGHTSETIRHDVVILSHIKRVFVAKAPTSDRLKLFFLPLHHGNRKSPHRQNERVSDVPVSCKYDYTMCVDSGFVPGHKILEGVNFVIINS